MHEQRKLGGCLGVILLIAVIVGVVFIAGDTGEDSPTVPFNQESTPEITESPLLDPGLSSLDFLLTDDPTESTNPFSDTLQAISMEDGFFRVNTVFQEAAPINGELRSFGSCESSWAGSGTVGSCTNLPMTLDHFRGDCLFITESQWNALPQAQKDSMTITFYPAAALGYGNQLLFDTVALDTLEAVEDISLSGLTQDPDAVNDALLGTGFKCLHCKKGSDSFYHLLADTPERSMPYTYTQNGQTLTDSAIMSNPYISFREDAPISVPVRVTEEGFYMADLSFLDSGYYVVDGMGGFYAVAVI